MPRAPKRRIFELDLLRGFFICVIVLDHLQFWPSPFQYMTGQGRLWVSAAEGFFLISGLLIGYLRAYKGAKTPLKELTKILWKRAAMLYVWCVIITLAVIALSSLMPGSDVLLPKYPDAALLTSLPAYLWHVMTTAISSDWIYFLRLYAIMLAVTPGFLWLIRRGWWWAAGLVSLGLYAYSLISGNEEAAFQWQVLFFGAAFIGWKFEAIIGWLRRRPRLRIATLVTLIATTLVTMALSYFMVHGWSIVEAPDPIMSRETYVAIRSHIDPWFTNSPMVPGRIALSFLWFAGLLALFHVLRRYLMKYLSWLLLKFGQNSLTVYCLQALVLVPTVTFAPYIQNDETRFWLNGLMGLSVILLLAGLIRIPFVTKILPR